PSVRVLCPTPCPTRPAQGESRMRRDLALLVFAGLLAGAARAPAQATGTPTFNAPYRAFQRSEIGLLLSFPNGGGTAVEGAYRMASGRLDLGFKVGFFDPPGPGSAVALAGVEARQRVITHTLDFPLVGAVLVGVGGLPPGPVLFVRRGGLMKRALAVLMLAAFGTAPAAAQWLGMPSWNSPKGGGVAISADYGQPNADARKGTAYGARLSLGVGTGTLTAG